MRLSEGCYPPRHHTDTSCNNKKYIENKIKMFNLSFTRMCLAQPGPMRRMNQTNTPLSPPPGWSCQCWRQRPIRSGGSVPCGGRWSSVSQCRAARRWRWWRTVSFLSGQVCLFHWLRSICHRTLAWTESSSRPVVLPAMTWWPGLGSQTGNCRSFLNSRSSGADPRTFVCPCFFFLPFSPASCCSFSRGRGSSECYCRCNRKNSHNQEFSFNKFIVKS